MSADAGRVEVRLVLAGGRVARAGVAVRRPVGAVRALAGRPVADALRLVPLLFAVCGTAQGVAAVAACEAAMGVEPSRAQAAARALLALAEQAQSHAWHALVDGPRLLGEAPDAAGLARVRKAFDRVAAALRAEPGWLRPGGGAIAPDRAALADAIDGAEAALHAAVFGGGSPQGPEALAAWAASGGTAAARVTAHMLRDAAFGTAPVHALPELPAGWFAERLAADSGFAERPTLDGRPAVTGPLARHGTAGGTGLAIHAAARLAEVAALPGRMRALLPELAEDAGRAAPDAADGAGAGVAETARGRLAHWMRLERGRVADFRSVAPTEWNFHPDGALARGLSGAEAGPGLEERVRLLVTALDPCVPWTLDIEGAHHA